MNTWKPEMENVIQKQEVRNCESNSINDYMNQGQLKEPVKMCEGMKENVAHEGSSNI